MMKNSNEKRNYYSHMNFKQESSTLNFNPMKRETYLTEVLREKNQLIIDQNKRINYLEEKMMELRQKYFQLKYDDQTMNVHIQRRLV
jgi:TolA-binding protein